MHSDVSASIAYMPIFLQRETQTIVFGCKICSLSFMLVSERGTVVEFGGCMDVTRIYVDVDQTASTGHVCATLAESVQYYRQLGVVVPDDVASWPELFQLPEILIQHEVIPGALAGVRLLAEHGEIAYLTVRKPDVRAITQDWLSLEDFPSPDNVMICQSSAHKLLAIAEHPGQAVLIDDRWRKLLDCWPRLVEYAPDLATDLQQRLTLVAFGASAADLPSSPVVPVVPLPDWRSVADVLMALHKVVKKG